MTTAAKVLAVIVLYKIKPQDSLSFTTLMAAAAAVPAGQLELKIILHDNTPEKWEAGGLPDGVEYVWTGINDGISEAYNRSLLIADDLGYEWLLTLDQDTSLPQQFLAKFVEAINRVRSTPVIAAIVPHIIGSGRSLSPNWFRFGAIAQWFKPGFVGVPDQATFAFNSGAMLRVSALRQIGGYDPWYWLDNSDASLFRKLHRHGKSVYVAGDVQVSHDFSMLDMQTKMTSARYRNILLAESAFWDQEMGMLAGLERTARLTLRLFRHYWRNEGRELRNLTREFLSRRLLWTRDRRIAAWREETLKRLPHLRDFRNDCFLGRRTSSSQIKVSVCMASYNGEKYIEEQLRSILRQLRDYDEVVIVDDASKDKTKEIIRSIQDSRVRLIEHFINSGVVSTFEESVRNATGEIIFLADDDDVWAPNKVDRLLKEFEAHPDAHIAMTRVSLIDQDGMPLKEESYNGRNTFQSGFWRNVLQNHFQGSAMAFRSSLLPFILPFPKRRGFLHDQWIGTRNAALGGSAIFLEEPLLLYRRHSQNFSRRMSTPRRIWVRWMLLWSHAMKMLRGRSAIG